MAAAVRRWLVLLGLVLATPAVAQRGPGTAGPSFDCAKAQSAIDRAICKDADLSKADRDLAAAYATLLDTLKGPEREDAIGGQGRWVANRNRACLASPDDIAECLKGRYATRIASLKALAVSPYPAVGEETLLARGQFGKLAWSYDIAFPRFGGKGADFAAVNTRYANDALKRAQDATPSDTAVIDDEQTWEFQQGYSLDRPPGGRLVTVELSFYGFSGGAHGNGATYCSAVDLSTGRFVTPAGVLGPQAPALVQEFVVADLRLQFKERPGDDAALEASSMRKMLGETERYCWRARHLEIVFNAYDVGPYAAGPYFVEIPYGRLKPVLRPDGPIAVR